MRDIKFDYIDRKDNKLRHSIVTLEEIERGINDDDDYKIVARRLFTGRKDKNGVEIYEGDVGVWPHQAGTTPRHHIVTYETDIASFVTMVEDTRTYYLARAESSFEVIGNVYENPELMEGLRNVSVLPRLHCRARRVGSRYV